jgi:HPt (histidine-containing phosphotransfer) domain-containing protein
LKGAVANFGAEATVHAARRLEELGRVGQMDQVEPAFQTLQAALERLTPELTALADGSAEW